MKTNALANVDVRNGICPGCLAFRALTILHISQGVRTWVCCAGCWNLHFAGQFGELVDPIIPAQAPALHFVNETWFSAYGDLRPICRYCGLRDCNRPCLPAIGQAKEK